MHQLKTKLLPVLLILLASAINSFAQAVIKLEDGFLFINNEKDKSFTLEIKGKDVKALESSVPMFMVDGKILQILIVPKGNFLTNDKRISGDALLEAHKLWETEYLGTEVYKTKLTLESDKLSFGERKALFWGFTHPNSNQQFDRDYFLTTSMNSYLLGLSSPATPKQSKADTEKFLSDLMKTLVVSDKPFDVTKLADEIQLKVDKPKN